MTAAAAVSDYGYGLWFLVVVNTAVILLFAASFFHPRSSRDWRAFGAFSAFVIASGWQRLLAAAKAGRLATDGVYRRVRHPQYAGFMLIMAGFLLQWPTIPTLLMFPVLVLVYRRLAVHEEEETRGRFGAAWDAYAAVMPRFIPHLRAPRGHGPSAIGGTQVNTVGATRRTL